MTIADQLPRIIALRSQRVSWEAISRELGTTPGAARVAMARARAAGHVPAEPPRALLQVKLSTSHDRWVNAAAAEHHVPGAQIIESALRCWLGLTEAGDRRRFSVRLHVVEPRVPVRRTFRVSTFVIEALRRHAGRAAIGYQGSLGEQVEQALQRYAKTR